MDPPKPFRPFLRRLRPAPALLAAAAVSSCFNYSQTDLENVAPGQTVRVLVFEEALDRVPAELERRTQIEGMVVEVGPDRLRLLPELGSTVTDPVSLAVPDIRTVARRELNGRRTWLAVAVGAALGAGVLLAVEGEPAGTGGRGPISEFLWRWTLPSGR